MYIYVGEMVSYSNQFMKSKSELVFIDSNDIADLEAILNQDTIEAFIKNSTTKEDLFK